jgi:hypothetical protein
VLTTLGEQGDSSVRDLLQVFPVERRKRVMLSLMWMAKAGILDWRPD